MKTHLKYEHRSEGDRYLLKLFRDYVFHQVDENGRPVLDFGHVVECLNKVTIVSGIDVGIKAACSWMLAMTQN